MKFRIRKFSFVFISAIIIIIFARFLNSRIRHPREIRENLLICGFLFQLLQEAIEGLLPNSSADEVQNNALCFYTQIYIYIFLLIFSFITVNYIYTTNNCHNNIIVWSQM